MRGQLEWYGFVFVLLIAFGSVQHAAIAQIVRSPELNLQYHRAEVAWRSGGSVLEAKARVDRVLEKLPEDVEALKLRAQVLMSMQKHDEALRDARKATALDINDGEAHLILAEAAYAAGHADVSLLALEAAAERVVSDASSHIRMSWLASRLDQLALAEAYARTALALDDRDPSGYYQLARVFVRQGRADHAAAVLANGLEKALLDVQHLRSDTELSRVLEHPRLINLAR